MKSPALYTLLKENAWMRYGAVLFLCMFSFSSCVSGPLQPKRDQSPRGNCLRCHPGLQERFQKGIVHAPVQAKNCRPCHLPHGLIGGVQLRTKVPGLCTRCHTSSSTQKESASSHSPFTKGQCLSCHDPHNSPYPQLLLQGETALCNSCHAEKLFNKKVVHQPVRQGCATCHLPHQSDYPSLLREDADALCLRCHQIQDAAMNQGHQGYQGIKNCLQCHTPHSSNRAKLLRKNVHPPMLRGSCDVCHDRTTKGVSLNKDEARLCGSCHGTSKQYQVVHTPFQEKICLSCHAAHASDYAFLLNAKKEKLCLKCHSAVVGSAKVVHPVEKEGGCLPCHSGHGSNNAHLLTAPAQALCKKCHSDRSGDAKVRHKAVREGRCLQCHKHHQADEPSLLRGTEKTVCLSCHEQNRKEMNRLNRHRPFVEGHCSACHDPHSSKKKMLIQADAGRMCVPCHATKEESKPAFTHTPFERKQCDACHLPHASDTPRLLKDAGGKLCLKCHPRYGAGKGDTSRSFHTPVAEKQCSTCHKAHGSAYPAIGTQNQPTLCLTCHPGVAQFWAEGVAHPPALKRCTICHDPHFKGTVKNEQKVRKQCLDCHQFDASLENRHNGFKPSNGSCIGCHDPHGSPRKGLTYAQEHTPFAQGRCDLCHTNSSAGNDKAAKESEFCLSCHERDRASHGQQHQPYASGQCRSCHRVHAGPYPQLTRALGEKLCHTCHATVPGAGKRFIHEPFAQGQCTVCHDPHQGKAALRKEKGRGDCLSCHPGVTQHKKYLHAPVRERQCDACHDPHGGDLPYFLVAPGDALCRNCHETGDLAGMHRDFPEIVLRGCLSCHDPHGGPTKYLQRKYLHAPYSKGCDFCHSGGVTPTTERCLACHEEQRQWQNSIHSHFVDNDKKNSCTLCHYPHGAPIDKLLRMRQGLLCGNCHESGRHGGGDGSTQTVHQNLDTCSSCHQVHGSQAPAMLKGDGNEVCETCHETQGNFTHPVGPKVIDPRNQQSMTCVTCHNPMGTPFPYHLKQDGKKDLCVQCHNY